MQKLFQQRTTSIEFPAMLDAGGVIGFYFLFYSLIAVMPLCENMPSGRALKPGDVVTAMNGKTIEVGNTDAEGRLILADALHHVHSHDPAAIIDLATLTGKYTKVLCYYHTYMLH